MEAQSRRSFLGRSAAVATGVAGGVVLARHVLRGDEAPSSLVTLALVGAGGRGAQLARGFVALPGVTFSHVCDPDLSRAEKLAADLARSQAHPPRAVSDFRRALEDHEVQGVVIATPEHWHALATIWACQAGKDVYVEKNPALTIWEGRRMVEAARKYRRMVQAGFQNRSGPYARTARDYIAAGKLGRIVLVKVYNLLPDAGPWTPAKDESAPAGFDWDLWQGPARAVPYNPGRRHGWTNYWDYAGGVLSGDASHQLDLTRMVLGDPPLPRVVHASGGRLAYDDAREVPDLQVLTFDHGRFVMTCESGTFTPYLQKFPNEVRYGTTWPRWMQSSTRVEIYGTRQMMLLGRHGCGWQVLEADGRVVAEDKGYFPDKWHQPDFVESIRTRRAPNADIEEAHLSGCLVHLGNIAHRMGGRRLTFDPVAERFMESEANSWLRPEGRAGYRFPEAV